MRLYLDTNIYCRPLDNQKDTRIYAETEAILTILDTTTNLGTVIVSSDYVKYEIKRICGELKRKNISGFEEALCQVNITSSKKLIDLANNFISECNLSALDALHTAAACIGKADYLLTCDDEITNKFSCIDESASFKGYKLKVRNPIKYLEGENI
jgi:predicted nucleic acid-binding protein